MSDVTQEFDAVLEDDPAAGGVFVVLPPAVASALGAAGPQAIRATLDGFPYQGSLVTLADGYHALPIPKEVRRALGKTLGDTLHVTLRPDDAPRQAELPADLAAALAAAPAAQAFYQKLPYLDQRAYVRWLAGTKTPEARAKRLTETLYRLGQGLKRA